MEWKEVEPEQFDRYDRRERMTKLKSLFDALLEGKTVEVSVEGYLGLDTLKATMHSNARARGIRVQTSYNADRTGLVVRRKA